MLGVSILIHVAILTPLALQRANQPDLTAVDLDPPMIMVEMEPRPLLPGESLREPVRQAAADAASQATVPARGEVLAGRVTAPLATTRTETPPAPPAPRIAATAPESAAAAAAADAWRVSPESMRAAVARSLRTGAVGCRAMDGRLSPSEQRLCDDRFNEAAGRAGPPGPRTLDASEARREARFAREGARALAQYEARRRPLSGGVGIVGVGDCPGSNLGAGCAGAHLDPAIRHGATTVGNPGLGSNDPEPMRPIPGQE